MVATPPTTKMYELFSVQTLSKYTKYSLLMELLLLVHLLTTSFGEDNIERKKNEDKVISQLIVKKILISQIVMT